MNLLTPYFSVEELTITQHRGINNSPDEATLANLKTLASVLEQVRSLLNTPMIISSGYRCLVLNRIIGSKDNSAHVKGLACDFISPAYGTPREIFEAIKCSAINYDQLIIEKVGGKEWVHLGLTKGTPRRQNLAITDNGVVAV